LQQGIDPRISVEWRRTLVLTAALGVLAYMAIALATDVAALTAALRKLGWLGVGLVLQLSLLNYGLRFLRWSLYVAQLGHRLSGLRHLLIYLAGFAFTVSPAKAGEAVRSIYLREQGVSYPESIAALFVERLLDLFAVALLACLIVFDQRDFWPLLAVALLSTIGLLVAVGQPALPGWLDRFAARRQGCLGCCLACSLGERRASAFT
jgi:uncharacterized protein (TIRG00374 family)